MADFICLAVASQYPEHTAESTSMSSFRLNASSLLGRRQSKCSEVQHTVDESVSMHVRIVPSIDNPRRSLIFDVVDRELKAGTVVKIGRFTDRSVTNNHISFKSKVVSRTHCEIWLDAEDGKLYMRDTKSSSGSFVNHSRLSGANQESRPVEVHDGDIVQLGVDYQGGVEEMYRAVKMRFELNRRPQQLFNSSTFKQLVRKEEDEDHGHSVDECCICLYAMAPFQALFVAPCCHTYHFKCIRPLLESYPGFQCPLCRTYSDLEASVEEVASDDSPSTNTTPVHEHDEEEARSGDPSYHPDPLDTTLVLSPSNLSGILSNPSSPSGQQEEQQVLEGSRPEGTTTRRNSEHQRRNTATNFVDKLKMAFSLSEKKEKQQQQQQQQQQQRRRSTIRPLSYPNLWRRDDSENEDESDDRPQAAGSSPSSSSCASPSSSPPHPSAGILARTLSAQSSSSPPHLADIAEESTTELSRPVTMN